MSVEELEYMSKVPHLNVVGYVMYVMISTHPSISHVAIIVSRYKASLRLKHFCAVK